MGRAGEEEEVVGLVHDYFAAIADRDWAGVCDTRTAEEQEDFARDLGSCEQAVQVLFNNPQAQELGEVGSTLEPESVRISGDRATVELSVGTFRARREGAEWKLFDNRG